MDAIESLRADHRIVMRHVVELEAAAGRLGEGGGRKRGRAALERAARWFLGELPIQLERRTESVYGRAVHAGGRAAEAARQLTREHDETTGLVDDLRQSLVSAGSTEDLRRSVRALSAHLREHVWKEEHLLLPCLEG